jgi:hypothetical protein
MRHFLSIFYLSLFNGCVPLELASLMLPLWWLWLINMEHRPKDIERENTKINGPSTVLLFRNQTWVVLGLKQFLRGQKVWNNCPTLAWADHFPSISPDFESVTGPIRIWPACCQLRKLFNRIKFLSPKIPPFRLTNLCGWPDVIQVDRYFSCRKPNVV